MSGLMTFYEKLGRLTEKGKTELLIVLSENKQLRLTFNLFHHDWQEGFTHILDNLKQYSSQ